MGETKSSGADEKIIALFLRRQGLLPRSVELVSAREQAHRWLGQFDLDERGYMLEVMSALRIETTAKINRSIAKLAKSIVKALANRHAEAIYIGIGDSPASSGNHFLYPLLAELNLSQTRARSRDELPDLLRQEIPLVFIDDIVGSGNQAIRYSKSIFPQISSNSYYGCLYGLESGVARISKDGHFGKVLVANLLTDKDCAFTRNSQVFADPSIRRAVKRIAAKYGRKIYPKHPLGYDGSSLLISFPHNTPNNTLPIVWGGVESESSADHWEPLLARKKAPRVAQTISQPSESLPAADVKLPVT